MKIGDLAIVKNNVWKKWCQTNDLYYHEFHPQPIVALPSHPPYENSVLLAFPLWWNENEIELVINI